MNQTSSQIKYRLVKAINFIIINKDMVRKFGIEMYSTHDDGKFVVAERFTITLKIKSINTQLWFQKIFILINLMIESTNITYISLK